MDLKKFLLTNYIFKDLNFEKKKVSEMDNWILKKTESTKNDIQKGEFHEFNVYKMNFKKLWFQKSRISRIQGGLQNEFQEITISKETETGN